MKKWLSVKEVCELIGVSRATLDRWANDPDYERIGFPKPFKLGFRRTMYEADAVYAFVDNHPRS